MNIFLIALTLITNCEKSKFPKKGELSDMVKKENLKVLIDKNIKEMIKRNKEKIDKWKINEQEIKEAKEEIYKINLIILDNDLENFIKYLGDKLIYECADGELYIFEKKDLVKKGKLDWLIRLTFDGNILIKKGLKRYKYNFNYSLNKILNKKNIMGEESFVNIIFHNKESEFYNIGKDKSLEYFFGIPNEITNIPIGFGIMKIKGKWHIISFSG